MPTKQEIANRLKDQLQGITPGAPNLHPTSRAFKEEEPIPDIKELGVPLRIRTILSGLVLESAGLAEQEKTAAKARKPLTNKIKTLLVQAEIEAPAFWCAGLRVSSFKSTRTSFNADILRDELLHAGVKPAIITSAMEAAAKTTVIDNLRITQPGEEEE